MKKQLKILISMINIIMFFAGCSFSAGKVDNVNITIGTSSMFSKEEIDQAINVVKLKFKSLKGCELIELWYDEEEMILNSGVTTGNVIVLYSKFQARDESSPGLDPNIIYKWHWTLIRENSTSKWVVSTYGGP